MAGSKLLHSSRRSLPPPSIYVCVGRPTRNVSLLTFPHIFWTNQPWPHRTEANHNIDCVFFSSTSFCGACHRSQYMSVEVPFRGFLGRKYLFCMELLQPLLHVVSVSLLRAVSNEVSNCSEKSSPCFRFVAPAFNNSTNACHRRLAIMGRTCKLGVLAALAFIASPASAGCPFLSGEKVRYSHERKCGRTHAPDRCTECELCACSSYTPAVDMRCETEMVFVR